MIGYEEVTFDVAIGTCNRAGVINDSLLRASKMLNFPVELREVRLGGSDHEHFWYAGTPRSC